MIPDQQVNGKWLKSRKINKKSHQTISYSVWHNLVRRCNDPINNPSYICCSLSEGFSDFQTFAYWYTKQIGYNCGYHLDKDLLKNGNKIYCEDWCVLIPRGLNNFLCDAKVRRGVYKQGVSLHKNSSFVSHISVDGVSTYLGSYATEDEAYTAYSTAKNLHARKWAERLRKYEFTVDPRVIEALENFNLKESSFNG